MGGSASKPEDIVAVARAPVNFSPPLGPPVRCALLFARPRSRAVHALPLPPAPALPDARTRLAPLAALARESESRTMHAARC
jgi:hypothetical protein